MNIYDIAKLSGVSIATVSRVVNDSPRVSSKTKQKVRKVMEEQGYTPNVFARGLGLDSMKTIGIICPDVADIFMAEAVAQLEKGLHKHDYDCILSCSGYETETMRQSVELLLKKRIDALILVGSLYAGAGKKDGWIDLLEEAAQKVPVFLINGYIHGDHLYCTYGDDYKATYDVTNQMIQSGRKRILFLCDSNSYSAVKKLEGYEDALKANHLPVLGSLKLNLKNQIHFVRDMLLERRDLQFDAVVATDDSLAVGAIKYAKFRQFQIPNDLCVTGFNNSNLSVCSDPELSTIDNQIEELCAQTIKNMICVLHGKPAKQNVKLECKLIKRETTDF